MQKKYWLFLSFMVIVLVAGFLLAGRSNTPAIPATDNSVCCKVKMEECLEKQQRQNAPGEMIMETLSRQFLTLLPY